MQFNLESALTRLFPLVLVSLAILPASAATAQRPSAPNILPEDTLLYLRVDDAGETVKRFKQTALGRISRDKKIEPLVTQLYGSAVEAFKQVEEQIGASLEDLLSIPQGEICFALVAPEQGAPAPVLLIDAGQRLPIVQKLFERIEQLIADRSTRTEERLGDTRLVVHQFSGRRQRQLVYAERDEMVIVAANVEVAKTVLKAWAGEAERTLSDDPVFTAVMRRCTAGLEDGPQITFFIDPINLFAKATRNNIGAQATMALFPALGLNGIKGVGGSMTFATEEYDGLTHFHVLLDSPREGIPAMLALKSGETAPEPWVPADVVSYMTLNWDLVKTYSTFEELFDGIRGEGALESSFESELTNNLELNFREDLLEQMEGRITLITWMVKPAKLNSRSNLIGLKLKDADAFRKIFDNAITKVGEGAMTRKSFGGIEYWAAPTPPQPEPDDNQAGQFTRQPDPAVAILDDYLVVTDSTQFLEQVITTKNSGSQLLSDELDYRLIASKIRRLPGGDTPEMITFNRPEEAMRLMYELATAETTRQQMSRGAENNAFVRVLDGALRDNPLPPFSAIARYLAPGGSLLTNDESGLHMVIFTLRRK